MYKKTILKRLIILLINSLIIIPSIFAQTSVDGVISDAETGETIIDATIEIEGTSTGITSDIDGSFSLKTDQVPPFNIVISYTGFASQTVKVTASNTSLDIKLESIIIQLEGAVVKDKRIGKESQDDSTAGTSIDTKTIESVVYIVPTGLLTQTVGVSIEKQGGARTNISIRGGSDLFSTSAYILMDFRSLIGVGLNTFDATQSALNTIDIERVDVVRGPGSALWGPGVTSGVVHFITKNPFKDPGGTIEVVGGNLNTFRVSARYAGHTKNLKLGYKINASYMTNGEWGLDSTNTTDATTIATFQDDIIDPLTGNVVRNTGGQLADGGYGYGANLTLYYKPIDKLSIIGSGGFNYSQGLFWNSQGEGFQAATDYFGQVRAQYDLGKEYGSLFAQIYYNANIAPNDISKKGFLYRSGNISVINRAQFEAQLQHNVDINPIRTNVVSGIDVRRATFDSETRTFGRNEQDDDFNLYGIYLQTTTGLVKDKLDLILAGRYDSFNAIEQNTFSPRAALVYKIKDNMTARVSYNRAYAPNSNLELNIDFPLANAGPFDIWLYGNKNAQTFNDPISTTWLVPGLGESEGLGMGIGTSYAFITQVLDGLDIPSLEPLMPILQDPNTMAAMAAIGTSTAGYAIDLDGNPMNIENTSVSKLREDNTLEIGFNGVFKNKFSVAVDLYQINRKNFTGLRQISPLVVLPTLGADLEAIVPTLTAIFTGVGVPNPAATAAAVGQAYVDAGNGAAANPLGIVETDQVPQEGDAVDTGLPHMAFGYRNFGKVTYYGMDIALGYQVNKEIKTFANYSWVNKNAFTGSDLGEAEGSTNRYDLNFAQHKVRAGASYQETGEKGFLGGLNMSYNSEFNSTLGFYDGTVESRFLVDANFGYKLKQGLFLSLSVENILNKKYRTFPSMPEIGTRVLATVRYTFKPKSENEK